MSISTIDPNDLVLVSGAGGFIGGHLVARLRAAGHSRIRAVDIKPHFEWQQRFNDVANWRADLRLRASCEEACRGAVYVFNLASERTGLDLSGQNNASYMLTVLMDAHMLMAARDAGCRRFFYSSSTRVYPASHRTASAAIPLKEPDAYPAMPENGYGWEKLFTERLCRQFTEDFGLETRVARYHNVYGPFATYDGRRETVPIAICREIVTALIEAREDIEIHGDGEQTRSFTYIDDCIEGTLRLMASDVREPLNIGSDEVISINKLVELVEDIARVKLERRYRLPEARTAREQTSDNALIHDRLGWAPSTPLRVGLRETFNWLREHILSSSSPNPA